MPRSNTGKIKLDIERLERRDAKLLRRLDNIKRAVAQNHYVLEALKKSLLDKLTKEVAMPTVSDSSVEIAARAVK